MQVPHNPVLLKEFLSLFASQSIRFFLDGTLGAGGHSAALLEEHPEVETLYGIDQDPQALGIAREKLQPWHEKVKLIQANFSQFTDYKLPPLDGILVDLGVSSMQLDRPERGFSFLRDGPLDMRMDPNNPLTAAEIVNSWTEKELGRIFRDYGEEKKWRAAAKQVVEKRKAGDILTTGKLVEILDPILRKPWKKGGIHPLTLIFQGLRICVNKELEVLEKFLPAALEALKPKGILAVITFHSLEDRVVKNFFRDAASDKVSTSGIGGMFLDKNPQVVILSRKPIVPSDEECEKLPRSRSAKMRAVQKIG